jgi:hypothetical protein
MNYNIIGRVKAWIFTATPVVVHSSIPFHLLRNPIESGTPLTQFTQDQCRSVGNLHPWLIDIDSRGQITVEIEADGEAIAPETIEFGIVALLQANTKLGLQATVPMPSHFHDKTSTRRDYGKGDHLNIYFGLVINAELILRHPLGQVQISDISSGNNLI